MEAAQSTQFHSEGIMKPRITVDLNADGEFEIRLMRKDATSWFKNYSVSTRGTNIFI